MTAIEKTRDGSAAHVHRRVPGSPPAATGMPSRRAVLGCLLIGTAVLTGSAEAQAVRATDLTPFSVTYTVGNNLVSAGNATLELVRDDENQWTLSLGTRPTGIFKLTGKGKITETSVFSVERDGDELLLRPSVYAYRQDDEARRAVDAAWDWDAGTLQWTRRGETETTPLDEPIIDRLSVTLGVMSALRQGRDSSEYYVFDSGRLKHVVFENDGTDTIQTAQGEIETIKVLRRNVDGSLRTTITWFAPSLDYMPVKIEQLKRDKLVARLTLKSLRTDSVEIDEPLIEPAVPVAPESE